MNRDLMTKRTPTYISRPTPEPEIRYKHDYKTVGMMRSRIASSSYAKNQTKKFKHKRKMALLLPGHNEELIIAATIKSAIKAGQPKRDIFVVDDCSTDNTAKIAIALMGKENVLSVHRSGKALAVKKAVKKFNITKDYQWLHVADADSVFSPNYFRIFRKKLSPEYAVALGFVQSLRGNWISTYRALSYTFSQHVNRRIQSYLGMISVFPGPITCFRTDILPKLDIDGNSLTEDFDITLQVHRKKLGKIKFIPKAVNYTQDPQTFRDFCKQNLRWQRGLFQGITKYRVGFKFRRIDASIGFQLFQLLIFLTQFFILIPMIIIMTGDWMILPTLLVIDFIVNSAIAIWASFAAKRWNLLGAMPYFYFLRWTEMVIFLIAFFEVVILGRFKNEMKGWETQGRRYALSAKALSDTAH